MSAVAAAAPVTYAAAPQVTYAAAAPAVTYAAGTTTVGSTVAAPVQYVTAQAGSYVPQATTVVQAAPAATVVQAAPAVVTQAVAGPPPPLTVGIPDPATIESQKDGYAKALAKQFSDGSVAIAEETRVKKAMLIETAKEQKALYEAQAKAQLQGQMLLLDQQQNSQLMMLQEAAMAQKSALEQQAAALTLEYQQKKAEEEMMAKQYEIQKAYYEAEIKLQAQYQKVTGDEIEALNNLRNQQPAAMIESAHLRAEQIMHIPTAEEVRAVR